MQTSAHNLLSNDAQIQITSFFLSYKTVKKNLSKVGI